MIADQTLGFAAKIGVTTAGAIEIHCSLPFVRNSDRLLEHGLLNDGCSHTTNAFTFSYRKTMRNPRASVLKKFCKGALKTKKTTYH